MSDISGDGSGRNDAERPRPVFHEGEIRVQKRVGVAEAIAPFGQMAIRNAMPDQHRAFFENIPMMIVGAMDAAGRPWASGVFGWPGFMRSPDPETLDIEADILMGRALGLNYETGAKLGFVGIELETRRRNRMNGVVAERRQGGFSVRVDQSFGNCPQYIQRRQTFVRKNITQQSDAAPSARREPSVFSEAKLLIETSDTFFIASRTPGVDADRRSGVDASHRGGLPGFVRVDEAGMVSFPDFSGNRFFNTLGNITADGRVGLFFPNFQNGDAVFLTGRAMIVWEDDPRLEAFAGAHRLIDVIPEDVVLVRDMLPLKGVMIDYSPQLQATGTWPAAS